MASRPLLITDCGGGAEGMCFFRSMAFLLAKAPESNAMRRLRSMVTLRIEMDFLSEIAQALKASVVARILYCDKKETVDALECWKSMVDDSKKEGSDDLVIDLQHFKGLCRFSSATSPEAREYMAQRMCSNSYWAEQFCLETVSEFLDAGVAVYDMRGKVIHPVAQKPEILAVHLCQMHYRAITFLKRSVLDNRDLEIIGDLSKKWGASVAYR